MKNEYEFDGTNAMEDDEDLDAFIQALSKVYDETANNGTWILNPESVAVFNMVAAVIKRELKDQNVEIEVQQFGMESHIGTITITSRDLIVFPNPSLIAQIGRNCIGIDFSAYVDGTTEIIFSFKTATKI